MHAALIALHGVTAAHGRRRVLEEVDLSVFPGDLLVLVGADGSGKSTLLRLLAGLLAPAEGAAERRVERAGLGFAGAAFDLYPDLTAEENLRFFATLRGVAADRLAEATGRLLARTGLEEARGRLAGRLSGGMRKKLALAVSLVHEPALLLLDEPTVGVDAASRRELWDIVARANAEGTAVVYTSPYLDEAERAQRVVLLEGGRAKETTSDELLSGVADWRAWVAPVSDRTDIRRRLAAARLGPRAYLRQEGLTVLARDGAEARALLAAALGGGPAPEVSPGALTVEDAFVLLAEGGREE